MQRQTWLVVTFYTTDAAMAMERWCGEQGISGRLFPAPRAVTADCGIAWRMAPEDRNKLSACTVETEGIYEMEL